MKPSWEICGECHGRKHIRPTVCDNCGGTLQVHHYNHPDGPIEELENCAGFRSYGGYGWFHDDVVFHPGEEPEMLYFCHDCCLKLFVAFPAFEKAYGDRGLHGYDDNLPCCKYGWTFKTKDGVEGTEWGDGTWEPHDPCPGKGLKEYLDGYPID